MKKLLIALFSIFCMISVPAQETPSYEIDPVATANAPWEENDEIWESEIKEFGTIGQRRRLFTGVAIDGAYLVRDEDYFEIQESIWNSFPEEFRNHVGNGRIVHMRSDPYRVIKISTLKAEQYPAIDGNYMTFYVTGERHSECYFEHGSTIDKPCTSWYRNGDKMGDIWIIDGKVQRFVGWFTNGQKSSESIYNSDGEIVQIRMWDTFGNLTDETNFDVP